MADVSVRRLGWCLLLLTVGCVVHGQRLKGYRVRSALCSTDINPLKNVCYLYEDTKMEFLMALAACEFKGGTLAALDTAETYNFVKKEIFSSVNSHFWIGYNEDDVLWSDGSPFIWSHWYKTEPNSEHEKCVLVLEDADFTFCDYMCTKKQSRLCQLPGADTQAHARVEENAVGPVSLPRSERHAESKFRCGQYCLQDPLCGKFNFHPNTLKCTLYEVGSMVDEADGCLTFTF